LKKIQSIKRVENGEDKSMVKSMVCQRLQIKKRSKDLRSVGEEQDPLGGGREPGEKTPLHKKSVGR